MFSQCTINNRIKGGSACDCPLQLLRPRPEWGTLWVGMGVSWGSVLPLPGRNLARVVGGGMFHGEVLGEKA